MFDIKEEVKRLPVKPGVYIMRDKDDNILYVGKAIKLKNRVSQYFNSSKKSYRIQKMVSQIDHFEYIVTDNELEALVLECNLIKQNKPKYNVMLKDDKTYPYIKVTINETFPRIYMTRRIDKDGAKYFGPYTDVGAVYETLNFIKAIFPIKLCKKKFDENSKPQKPCLNYHIEKCLAPCRGNIAIEEYADMINDVINFLEGKEDKLLKKLEKKMLEYSDKLEFEKAADLKKKIDSIKKIYEKQRVLKLNSEDMDVIGIYKFEDKAQINLFAVRNGKLILRKKFVFNDVNDVDECEILEGFIGQFYMDGLAIPKKIIIRCELESKELINEWLSELKGSKVEIIVPAKGEKNRLLEMAEDNAAEQFEKSNLKFDVQELSKLIKSDKIINRIEAYDISNIGNSNIVGAMVVWQNGRLDNSKYRKFKIKSTPTQDDIASTYEVLNRRLRNAKEGQEKFLPLPDLILADGGANQVNAINRAISQQGYNIDVIGMVKDNKHKTKALYLPNKSSIQLSKYPELMKFIFEIQEEVHRVAIGYHQSLREKDIKKSLLDEIKGIGEKRKIELLKEFKSIDKIKEASVEEIAKVKGMNLQIAKELKQQLENI